MKIKFGVDVGNFDTKTQHIIMPSSFRTSSVGNMLAGENLFYNGNYFIPTMERNNQQKDKTENDYCIIMTLFGMAKELIYQITTQFREKNGRDASPEEIQSKINQYDVFRLGVGLPVGHIASLAEKTAECYKSHFINPFSFTYNQYEFHMKMEECTVFPQDFIAVAFNPDVQIVKEYGEYYIIGIGGGTADIIPVVNGTPVIEKCETLLMGTTVMYQYIISSIQRETGDTMNYSSIESILLNKPSIVKEDRKKRIKELEAEFVNKLVDEIEHKGMRLSDYPCVFIGGGALMMKPTLESNSKIAYSNFITDVNANAKFYASFA